MPESATELHARITCAVNAASKLMYDEESEQRLDAHCRWELGEILKHIRISDLLSAEVLAVLAILCPVHSRVLAARISPQEVEHRPILSVIHCGRDD